MSFDTNERLFVAIAGKANRQVVLRTANEQQVVNRIEEDEAAGRNLWSEPFAMDRKETDGDRHRESEENKRERERNRERGVANVVSKG